VRQLLDAGARVDIRTAGGKTALIQAARNGHVDIVRTLLDAGAEVDETSDGVTALWWAAATGATDLVTALLLAGADVRVRSPAGATALMIAERRGYHAIVEVLAAPSAALAGSGR
jgi:ankyrin repeat protein